ncbi:TIGR03936 family radical SAM-associated protein [Christensenellaceae bacterium OttesenSCG-928-L17]|nr:TIGR03936 family radical SAM-associated protein [Christensenellaceae bacterium OttesenSCG-928-L17]
MRLIANFHKGEALRFISHLDIQRLLQRALKRADMPVSYSQGFNPHPLLAFSSALALGYTSDAEWMDVRMEEAVDPQEFPARLNAVLPEGLRVVRAMEIPMELPTLTALMQRAEYIVDMCFAVPLEAAYVERTLAHMLEGPIVVNKKTKGGMKDVDMRPLLIAAKVLEAGAHTRLWIDSVLNASGGLQMELFLKAFACALGEEASWRVHRSLVQFDKIEG